MHGNFLKYYIFPAIVVVVIIFCYAILNNTVGSSVDLVRTFTKQTNRLPSGSQMTGTDKNSFKQSTHENFDLSNLEKLISEYNDAARKSSGVLKTYSGPNFPTSVLKWAFSKLIHLKSNNSKDPTDKSTRVDQPAQGKGGDGMRDVHSTPDTSDQTASRFSLTPGPHAPQDTSIVNVSNRSQPGQVVRRLVLFSTWVDVPEKRLAQENVLRTWRLWKPLILPLVFTDDSTIQRQAVAFGWQVSKPPMTACGGVPVLREMFRKAMATHESALYGYINGDLLLGHGLLSTVEALVEDKQLAEKPLMAIIRRTNVDFRDRPVVENVNDLESIADQGRVMTDGSSDGFLTNRLFPWDHVPDIVPGRLGVAMWLVSFAREMGVRVIDLSQTVTAVHMTVTKAGNSEGWQHQNPRCNHKLYERMKIKPLSWFCGFFTCAGYRTTRSVDQGGNLKVKVEDKTATNHRRCAECDMDLSSLINTVF